MKISSVVVHRLSVPLPRPVRTAIHNHAHADTVVVELRSDAGAVGSGYCFAFGARRADALAALVEDLVPFYEGKDPAARGGPLRGGLAVHQLHRALGPGGDRAVGARHRLLGPGRPRGRPAALSLPRRREQTRVPTYASSGLWIDYSVGQLLAEADQFRAQGHRAMKMRVGGPDPRVDVERARLLREALGPEIKLLADVNQGWDEPTAIRVGRELEAAADLYWLEEPLPYEDLEGCARVAAALTMRVATGESDYGSLGMKRHLDVRAADVLMPDLQRMGGVTEYRRAGELCRAYGQPVSSHLFMEASCHVLAAAPNALILEHMDWWEALFAEPLRIVDGCVLVPDRPGIGVELDPKALARFRA